jgi:hypothetical protein
MALACEPAAHRIPFLKRACTFAGSPPPASGLDAQPSQEIPMRTAIIHPFTPVRPSVQLDDQPSRQSNDKDANKPPHKRWRVASALAMLALGLGLSMPGFALDLVAFTGITGPLTSALAQISALGPSVKALVGFVGFVVALISLSALRNFGPVLFYVGLAIFGAVGLVIAGAIMGAVV